MGNKSDAIWQWKSDEAQALRVIEIIPVEQRDSWKHGQLANMRAALGDLSAALAEIAAIKTPGLLHQYRYEIRSLLAARATTARHFHSREAYRDKHPQSWRAYPSLALPMRVWVGRTTHWPRRVRAIELLPPEKNPRISADSTLRKLAEVKARFGQIDEALTIVRDQIERGWWRRNLLLLDPDFFILQKDPRFRAIAEKAPL